MGKQDSRMKQKQFEEQMKDTGWRRMKTQKRNEKQKKKKKKVKQEEVNKG